MPSRTASYLTHVLIEGALVQVTSQQPEPSKIVQFQPVTYCKLNPNYQGLTSTKFQLKMLTSLM